MRNLILREWYLLAIDTRHTEINKLKRAVTRKHQVVWLKISMHDKVRVHIVQSA